METTWWIWNNNSSNNHQLLYFRKKFNNTLDDGKLKIKVSADSLYKLYFNGLLVSLGPCKGTHWNRYYEEVDLTPYLKKGCNILAAKVMRYAKTEIDRKAYAGPASVIVGDHGGFLVEGYLKDNKGTELECISTNESWLVYEEKFIKHIPPDFAVYLGVFEHMKRGHINENWITEEYDESDWEQAEIGMHSFLTPHELCMYGESNNRDLIKRPIPILYMDKKSFKGFGEVLIKPNSRYIKVIDFGELLTAYPKIYVRDGKGAEIKLLYSEGYGKIIGGEYKKMVRDDNTGFLRGDYDLFEPNGSIDVYEPFRFRTFRFIQIEVTVGNEPITLEKFEYTETGYPLHIEGRFEASQQVYSKLWEVSIRTLKRCMHDTYEDCPYYEQLQYIMDTRLQALYTYQISRDDRLARKAIEDFHCSLTPQGLLQARYPSNIRQIIPGFSLHFIYMLYDNLLYFGDVDFIQKYLHTVDAILEYFNRKIDENGLVGNTGYWQYVDWTKEWEKFRGTPNASMHGGITVYNLMYAVALENAAQINIHINRQGLAQEYSKRKVEMLKSVRKSCWNESIQMFQDGANVEEYSVHVQLWAILAGMFKGKKAADLIERALKAPITQTSYAMSFYLFRALEQTGSYEKTVDLWKMWEDMLGYKLTTWAEDNITQRSDCHGWGALPLYEFPALILGVRPGKIGYSKITVKPHTAGLKYANGNVATKLGCVEVKWYIEKGNFNIEVHSPKGIPLEVILPNNEIYTAHEYFKGSCLCNI